MTTPHQAPGPDVPRSGCPVSLGLDIFGDRWTLLIVRDLMFSGKRHYRELLASAEHISTNILADRLKLLLAEGIVTRADDPAHQQKVIYRLTEKGVALLPVIMAISEWSHEYRPVGEAYRQPREARASSAAAPWADELARVRREHLGPDPGEGTHTP